MSGSVLVEVQVEDQLMGMKHNMIVGELGSGSALALLHDAARRATIVCKEQSEHIKDLSQLADRIYLIIDAITARLSRGLS